LLVAEGTERTAILLLSHGYHAEAVEYLDRAKSEYQFLLLNPFADRQHVQEKVGRIEELIDKTKAYDDAKVRFFCSGIAPQLHDAFEQRRLELRDAEKRLDEYVKEAYQ
jgi:hypothetical protein